MTCSTCTHQCYEGDACPGSVAASRLALGLHRIPFLADAEGGKAVAGGFAVSIARRAAEQAHADVEQSELRTALGVMALVFFLAISAAAVYLGVAPQYPFQ